MRERPLVWRIEDCCHNAWPSLRQVLLGDWMLRFADGISRRANSANPLRAQVQDLDAGIAACEALFRAQGLPTLFRIPTMVERGVDDRLERLGYRAEGETVTLHAGLATVAASSDPDVELLARPTPAWLDSMAEIRGYGDAQRATYGRIVDAIAIPAAFLALRLDGRRVALAYGAVHDGLLCCESVITEARHRGRGYSRRLLAAMMAWARRNAATDVCLQVEATNAPARALYAAIGLKTELYRYHYRRAPNPG